MESFSFIAQSTMVASLEPGGVGRSFVIRKELENLPVITNESEIHCMSNIQSV